MGFNIALFLGLFIPQLIILAYFNYKNIKNTGENKGAYNTANAIHGTLFALFTSTASPYILIDSYSLGGDNTIYTDLVFHVAISFFVCHGIFMALSGRLFCSETLHHLICISALLYSLITQNFGQDLLLTVFLGELTITHYPKIVAKNLKWAKVEEKLHEIFIYTFSIMRLIIFPVYLILFLFYAKAPFALELFAIAFVLLGVYFNLYILNKFIMAKAKHRNLAHS